MHRSLGEVSHEPSEPLHSLFLPPYGGLRSSDQNFALGFVLSVLPFRFCSLNFPSWNFQGCITISLSMCFCLGLSAATLIEYHVVSFMSRAFLNFFLLFIK